MRVKCVCDRQWNFFGGEGERIFLKITWLIIKISKEEFPVKIGISLFVVLSKECGQM